MEHPALERRHGLWTRSILDRPRRSVTPEASDPGHRG